MYARGDETKRSCRVEQMSGDETVHQGDLQAVLQANEPVDGLENVVLRSGCDGSVFDALGRRAFGPTATDLDRFPVALEGGRVIVDLSRQLCRPGSPCLSARS